MMHEERLHQVQAVLEELRPAIQLDGGDIELVAIHENIVQIRLKGACVGCPFSFYTVKMGIEQRIKEKVPSIVRVDVL